MNLWQRYIVPTTLSEALGALASKPGSAIPIAGGTDLLLDLEQGRHSPAHTLVDVSGVVEMTTLAAREGDLFIGAATPLSRIVQDSLVRYHAPALAEACELIGGPQVRNVATLGGNVAHALPAADGSIALLALGAAAEIASPDEIVQRPVSELFLGPGESALNPGRELIVGFRVPLKTPMQSSCFKRIMRPQGVALPIINAAVWLERQDARILRARIAIGPGSSRPWRAHQAETSLTNVILTEKVLDFAVDLLLEHVEFRTSPRRASAEYRRHIVGPLFRDTLNMAWARTWQETQ